MDWLIAKDPVPYEDAVREMEARVAGIRADTENEAVWLLEHPPLYTAGTSAKESDLLDPRFPVFRSGRGGEYTYHGPGQRVAYVMLDLKARANQKCLPRESGDLQAVEEDSRLRGKSSERKPQPDIKHYVWQLEEWIIRTLARFDIQGERREGRVGIWVGTPGGEKKIAAIGVRVRHWVSYHGIAINLSPDLSHFGGIVPCGIAEYGVTSLHGLGVEASMEELDAALKESWSKVF